MMLLYAQPCPMQLCSHKVRPRPSQRLTASANVVYSKLESQSPAMQSLFELDAPPSEVARLRHSLPSQHIAAIGSFSIGSRMAVELVTHTPEPSA